MGLNIDKILTATGDTNWRVDLESELLNLRLRNINTLVILTTHDTLASNDFINLLYWINTSLWNQILYGSRNNK